MLLTPFSETIRVFSALRDELHGMNGQINILSNRQVTDYNNHAPNIAARIEEILHRPARFSIHIAA